MRTPGPETADYAGQEMDWRDLAACRGLGATDFYDPESIDFGSHREYEAEHDRREAKAKSICHDCPVQLDCLNFAIETSQRGIWGGMTRKERDAERRRRARQARQNSRLSE